MTTSISRRLAGSRHGPITVRFAYAPSNTARNGTGSPAAAEWAADPAGGQTLGGLAVSADGRRLAFWVRTSWGPAAEARVWETATWVEAYQFAPPGGVTAVGFPPDGRHLLVGHADTSVTVWDRLAVESAAVAAGGVPDDLWDRLASPDPRVGLAAVAALSADPGRSLSRLRGRVVAPEPATVAGLVAGLGDPDFRVRERASADLAGLGDWAAGPLRRAARSESPEVRSRAERLLARLAPVGGRLRPEQVRAVRVVEAVERVGTPEARELLVVWSAAAPGSRLGIEATSAAARLGSGSK